MIEHVSSCKREHPKGKYLIKGKSSCYICFVVVVLLLYVFFDCECKSLDTLGENRKTTDKQTEKLWEKQKYMISSPGPDREEIYLRFRLGNNVFLLFLLFVCSLCFCLLRFQRLFVVCLFLVELVRLYIQTLKKPRQKQKENNKINTKQKQKTFEKNKQEIQLIRLDDIYSRSSGELEYVLYVCACCCLFYRRFVVVFLLLLFLPSCCWAFACIS